MKSYREALKIRKQNKNKTYCVYAKDGTPDVNEYSAKDRLTSGNPVIVNSIPKFKIEEGAKVYTIGSCFARNVESMLQERGFNLPVFKEDINQSIYHSVPRFPHTVLNKYNAHSMATEILKVLGKVELPNDGVLHFGDDKWFDPQMSFTKLLPRDLLMETKRKLDNIGKELIDTDVLVLTLGMTETWVDENTGLVFNNAITSVASYMKDSLAIFNSTPIQVYEVLKEALLELKKRNSKLKVILTVSPVPLTQTFFEHDVISANTYSKAALRVASQMLYDELDFVDYYPSYEMVTHSPRELAWTADQIHVSGRVVTPVINEFVNRYC